jgi:aspartate aminotransferase-like enzyme
MSPARLLTPGPTPVPPGAAARGAEQPVYHRSPEFRDILRRVTSNLQYLFQTSGPVLTLTASATGAVEATVLNLFSPGDTVICACNGRFAERWSAMLGMYGMRVIELPFEWGEPVDPVALRHALRANPDVRGVYLTHCETSTGTVSDIGALAAAVHEGSDALVCVDSVTAAGALELRFDDWKLDACVAGSQKGLMTPPGVSCVALSSRAIAAMERATLPRMYFDFRRALKALEGGDTPWTPASTLVAMLDESLRLIRDEGMEHVWARHRRLGAAFRAAASAMDLRLVSRAPADTLTALWLPGGVTWPALNARLRDAEGMVAAGGQGKLAGKIFRVAHMGYVAGEDIVRAVEGLARALSACGHAADAERAASTVRREIVHNTEALKSP